MTKFSNKLFSKLTKKNLKRFMFMIYCIAPLAVLAVGFSAWTIFGHNASDTGQGAFVADGIINSYDYIELTTESIGTINIYPTSIIGDKGNTQTTANIDLSYVLYIGKCRELVEKELVKDGNLYADFTLMFVSGDNLAQFFKNLNVTVTVTENKTEEQTSYVTENETEEQTYVTVDEPIKTDASHTTRLIVNPADAPETVKTVTLTFTYTLSFKNPDTSTEDFQEFFPDYQEFYNAVASVESKLMVDVRITDINPDPTA